VCQAVDSVLHQTLGPLEVIVVDDGSTDDTRELLKAYGNQIQYVYQENHHLSAARNTGICKAKGDWIAFLDADDLWHPQKLERQTAIINKTGIGLGIIGNDCLTFSSPMSVVNNRLNGVPKFQNISLRDLVYGDAFGSGSGAVVHRDCFTKVGFFDETLRAVEDLDMWFRIGAKFRICKILEPLTLIRIHANSMSTQPAIMEKNHDRVLAKAFSTIPELKSHYFWRSISYARMHRGVALMHAKVGNRSAALHSLWRSFWDCPLTSGKTSLGIRLRMAICFLFRK